MYKVSSQDARHDFLFSIPHPSPFSPFPSSYVELQSTVIYSWIRVCLNQRFSHPSACRKSIGDQAQSMITSFYKALFKNRWRYDVLGRGLTLKSHRDNPSAISDQTAVHRALTLSILCRQACPGNRRHWNVAQG